MTTQQIDHAAAQPTWQAPDQRSASLKRVRQVAIGLGLTLDAAVTQECAVRRGRYWLRDPVRKIVVLRAATLADVIAFLDDYTPPRPSLARRLATWLGFTQPVRA